MAAVLRCCAWLLLALGAAAQAQDQVPVPPLQARVTDLTGTLGGDQAAALEDKLAAFEKRKGSQVAVLIVPTTQPETIEQFGIRVADAWKLGRKGVDDGAILLVAKDDHKLRIEVGYGLEGALNDATCKRIIDEIIVPRFRQGDFAGGVDAGASRMLSVIDGEPLPPPPPARTGSYDMPPGQQRFWIILFVAVLAAGAILRSVRGALFTGGAAGVAAWIFTGVLLAGAGVGLLAFIVALLMSLYDPGDNWRNRGGGYWGGWGGGGFGGGGLFGGGGGGGGFSGGGGGFGGGGASGSW